MAFRQKWRRDADLERRRWRTGIPTYKLGSGPKYLDTSLLPLVSPQLPKLLLLCC
jgi:hypothetical protein